MKNHWIIPRIISSFIVREMSRDKNEKIIFITLSCLSSIIFNVKSNIQRKYIDLELSAIIFIKFTTPWRKFRAIPRRSRVVAAWINLSFRKVSLTSRSSRMRHFAKSISQTLRFCAFYSWLTARRTSWFIYEGARHFRGDVSGRARLRRSGNRFLQENLKYHFFAHGLWR